MSEIRRLASLLVVVALAAASCGTDGEPAASGPSVTVVASFYPLAEIASRVGGERSTVINLTPAGAEPHDLELSTTELDRILDSTVVFYLGGGFQPAIEEAVERRPGRSVDLLSEELGLLEGHDEHGHSEQEDDHDEHEDGVDPHVWLDPGLMVAMVERVRDVLVELDPAGRQTYEANAASYSQELRAVHDDFLAGLANCERSTIVTSHDAFGYLARAYGLTQESISGLSPESEPDPRRLAELADEVEEEGITTVFYETLVSPRVAEALAREAGVDVAVLNPLEGLTADEQQEGEDYASVMRANLEALRAALACS